jgi:hypothetical protein
LAAALALLAPAAARAEATTFTESFSVPVTPGYISCAGETVFLSGEAHVVVHGTIDADGGVHLMSEENFAGVRGVGTETGALYVATDSKRELFDGRAGGARGETIERSALLIAQGALPDAEGHVIIHMTSNANGVPTADTFQIRFECQA